MVIPKKVAGPVQQGKPFLLNLPELYPAGVINGILYGGPGVGKTGTALTARDYEHLRPILVIAFDSIDPTIIKFSNEFVKTLDVIEEMKSRNITISMMMPSLLRELDKKIPFKTVLLDNISKLMNPLIFRDIMAEAEVLAKARGRDHDPDVMEMQDYNRATNRVYGFLERARSNSLKNGYNLILTARERIDYIKTQSYEGDFYYPDLSPELRRLILHEYDFCFHMESGTSLQAVEGSQVKKSISVRYLHTKDKSDRVCKTKIGGLESKIKNPTLDILYQAYLKESNGHG